MTLKSDVGLNGYDAVRVCDYEAMQAELDRLKALEEKVREFCKIRDFYPEEYRICPLGMNEFCEKCSGHCDRCWLHYFGLEVNRDE